MPEQKEDLKEASKPLLPKDDNKPEDPEDDNKAKVAKPKREDIPQETDQKDGDTAQDNGKTEGKQKEDEAEEKEDDKESKSDEPGLASTTLDPVDTDEEVEPGIKDTAAYNDFTVDPTTDATSYIQVRNYEKFLKDNDEDKTALSTSLHDIVRRNQVHKLTLMCRFLKSINISLSDEDMFGSESKETALCLAVITGNTECAKILIEYGGEDLVIVAYTTKLHLGITALHLAILNQNLPIIECMLDILKGETKQDFLHKRATGSYFEDRFHCTCLPLSIAAAMGDIEIFNTLVRHGADLWVGDEETGNTVLHSLAAIAMRTPDLADATLKGILESDDVKAWWTEKKKNTDNERVKSMHLRAALLKAENKDGHTPLIYASCLGATQFVRNILDTKNVYKYPQWEVGPSSYSLYEVSELDPAAMGDNYPEPPNPVQIKKYRKTTGLQIFTFVLGDDHLDYGNIPIVKLAMINKWNAYKRWFFSWMVFHLVVMLLFTYTTHYEVPRLNVTKSLAENGTEAYDLRYLLQDRENQFVLFADCLVLVVALVYWFLEVYDIALLLNKKLWYSKSFKRLNEGRIPILLTLQFDVFRFILHTFSICVIIGFGLKLAQSKSRDFFCAVASISGWCFMLFFARAFRDIGIFVVMLQRMVMRELLYFSLVFVIIMTAFSTGTFCMFKGIIDDPPDEVSTMANTFYSHFRLLVGLEDLAVSEEARLPSVMKVIFVIFVVLANIMLMNMLIAAMNNTYTMVDNLKEIMWMKIRSKAVLLMERRLIKSWRPSSNLKKHGREYERFLGSEEVTAWHPLARGVDVPV